MRVLWIVHFRYGGWSDVPDAVHAGGVPVLQQRPSAQPVGGRVCWVRPGRELRREKRSSHGTSQSQGGKVFAEKNKGSGGRVPHLGEAR